MFRLKLEPEGEGADRAPYPVDDDVVRIGSSTHVDIRLDDGTVSHEHCEIRRSGTHYRLIDLESKHGTRVNGDYVNQCVLKDGDVLEVGGVTVRFERDAAVRPARRVPGRAPVGPPRVERRPRPPAMPVRRRRGVSTSALLAIAFVVVTLLIAVAISSVGGGDELTHNERVYREMLALEDQRRYFDAMAKADEADSSGDRDAYEDIERLRRRVEQLSQGIGPGTLERQVRRSKAALERFILAHEGEYGAIRNRVRDFLDRFGEHTHFAAVDEVRELARKYEKLTGGGDPEVIKYADAFAVVSRESEKDLRNQSFLTALQRHARFLETQGPEMPPDIRETYELRVDRRMAEIEAQMNDTWREIREKGEQLKSDDRASAAAELFRSVFDHREGWPEEIREEARIELLRLRALGVSIGK